MKPRLYLYKGVWHCRTFRNNCLRMGIGYTPELAYADWEAM